MKNYPNGQGKRDKRTFNGDPIYSPSQSGSLYSPHLDIVNPYSKISKMMVKITSKTS